MNYKKQRLIFLILYFSYTSIYVARVNLSVAGPEMIDANLLSTVQLGALGSAFSTIYAIGRLINGGMSDRKPPWLMLTTGLAVAGLSNILVGAFPPFIGVFVLWAANAYAQSMLWSSVLCVIAAVYDEKEAKKKLAYGNFGSDGKYSQHYIEHIFDYKTGYTLCICCTRNTDGYTRCMRIFRNTQGGNTGGACKKAYIYACSFKGQKAFRNACAGSFSRRYEGEYQYLDGCVCG